MRIFPSLFLGLFVFFTFPALSDEGESALPELNSEPEGRVFEMEFPYGSNIVLRVGSPIFNMLRNDARLTADSGEELSKTEEAILRIDEIEGVGPNSLLLFITDVDSSMIYVVRSLTRDYHNFHDNSEVAQIIGGFLMFGGINWVEVSIEDGVLYAGGLPLEYSTRQPFLEIMNSFRSDCSLLERFENSGVAIFDAASGMAYAGADIWGQLSEGEIVRAVKALLRIPFSGVQLGGTVAMKVLRLPFDLAVTGIQNLVEIFSEEENSLSSEIHDLHQEVRTKILDNNDYSLEVEITRAARDLSDFLSGIYRNTSLILHKEGIQTHFERGVGQLMMSDVYDAPIEFQWTAVHDDGTDFFVARATDPRPVDDRRPVDEGRNFLFMGTINGAFDIDIEGVIVESDMSIREVLRRGPRAETLSEFREQALGTFHFDDN